MQRRRHSSEPTALATLVRYTNIIKAAAIALRFSHVSLLLLATISITGCRNELQTGYGRASGIEHSGSLNGTAVFHQMLKSSGRKVHRYSQFSPRWEKYQTVYWVPDNFTPPREEIINNIDQWLANDSFRTMVYVCRDYDSTFQYWQTLKDQESNPEKKDELSRLHINSVSQHFRQRDRIEMPTCDWYKQQDHPFRKATDISGPLLDAYNTSDADLYYASLPIPGDDFEDGSFGDFNVEVLMSLDSHPFMYRLTKPEYDDSQIIIVGNASFLLNMSLVNESNMQIASALIDYVAESETPQDNILFIESSMMLPISDLDSRDKFSQWRWITKKPLRYIVPQLVFCLILLCFVYFPIFGRPRRINKKSTANFRDHIHAMAQLLKKSKATTIPRQWIEEYKKRTGRNRRDGQSKN